MIFAQAQAAPPAQLPLRDIHLPAEPSMWPLAPGWWLLIGVATVILIVLAWRVFKAIRHAAYIRSVKALLDKKMAQVHRDGAQVAGEVSSLLRRAALTCFPASEVASLAGRPWLEFLDRTGGNGAFCEGPGQVLGGGPWQQHTEVDTAQLKAVAGRWLEVNL